MAHKGCNLDVAQCAECSAEENREYVNTAPTCGPCDNDEHELCQGCDCGH